MKSQMELKRLVRSSDQGWVGFRYDGSAHAIAMSPEG
jgi:hypothetical protein